jgi:hypothetical protein
MEWDGRSPTRLATLESVDGSFLIFTPGGGRERKVNEWRALTRGYFLAAPFGALSVVMGEGEFAKRLKS